MSVFDALLAEVWSAAREDGSTLLADFAAPSSDAARAARALRLPQLAQVRRALRELAEAFSGPRQDQDEPAGAEGTGLKSSQRAKLAIARAQDAVAASRDLDAIIALSEAIRFARSGALDEALALGSRGRALLRLQQTETGLQDLRRARELLEPLVKVSDTSKTAPLAADLWSSYLRTLLDIASCLEARRALAEAEAVLREAMAAVRDVAERLDAKDKAQAVGIIMQRLKKIGGPQTEETPRPRTPLSSSGLDALPRLLAGPHPTLTSASAALEERVDARRGRHLVAAQNIPAGSAIIVERPFAWSLALEEMATHCLHCCSPVLAPLPCPLCSNVAFCGEDCRRAALSTYHRLECPLLRQLVAPQAGGDPCGDLTPMALLAFRIVARAARLGEVTGGSRLPQEFVVLYREDEDAGKKKRRRNKGGHLDGYGPVFAQVTHSEARTPADLLKRAVTAAYLTCCLEAVLPGQQDGVDGVLQEDEAQLLTTAFLRHLQSCSCNAYQVSEHRCGGAGGVRASRGVELGGACYPTVSLVNHACHPNVARHSHGSVCVVRAVRLIPQGSEVLDNYGPHFLELETEERRATLSKQYMFHCDCDACRCGWPTLEGLDRMPQLDPKAKASSKQQNLLQELSGRLQRGVQGMLEGRPEEALQAALKYSGSLQQLQQKGRPPSAEQVRAEQVAALCWSLAGNRVDF